MVRFLESRVGLRISIYLIVILVEGLTLYYSRQLGLSVPATITALSVVGIVLNIAAFDVPFFLMRGKWRYHNYIVGHQKVVPGGRVGQHISEYFRIVQSHALAKYVIRWPMRFAMLTTLLLLGVAVVHIAQWSGLGTVRWVEYLRAPYAYISDIRYLCIGYLPLLVSVPFRFEYSSEWRTPMYVLLTDKHAKTAAVLLLRKAWTTDGKEVVLKRAVSLEVHQPTFTDTWIINRGSLEIKETSGGDGEVIKNIYNPFRFYRIIDEAVNNLDDSPD